MISEMCPFCSKQFKIYQSRSDQGFMCFSCQFSVDFYGEEILIIIFFDKYRLSFMSEGEGFTTRIRGFNDIVINRFDGYLELDFSSKSVLEQQINSLLAFS